MLKQITEKRGICHEEGQGSQRTTYWGGALYLKITYQNLFFKNRFWKKISDKKTQQTTK
jgi:hypothetical protein